MAVSEAREKSTVWLLDEGTPGHTVQTAGLGAILSESGKWEPEWVRCHLDLRGWKRTFTRWNVGHIHKDKALACARKLYPGLVLPGANSADMVISSCGKSAYLNRLLCKLTGARGVFIGERKPFPANWFDLIITPVEEGYGNEMLMPVIESGRSVESGAVAMRDYWPAGAPSGCWTILIGGPSRTHRYGTDDWISLAEGINSLARQHGIRWLLSTSRRTGAEAESLLRERIDPAVLQNPVWYGVDPRKSVGAFLAAGERVFVTQDSLTMMSEGLAMDKRVELLVPSDWGMPEMSFNGRYVRRLLAADLVGRTSFGDMPGYVPVGNGSVAVTPLRQSFAEDFLKWADGKRGAA